MAVIQPYLFFRGRCDEAIKFYEKALGAKVGMKMRFKDNPDKPPESVVPASMDDRIMHASVDIAGAPVMMSDGMKDGGPAFGSMSLSLNVTDPADVDRYFNALADGGEIEMPLGKTFFAERFGGVKDKFGVSWMIICEAKRP